MLYCPKCGSANRRGSRFCNECGEMLPMHTGLRCPMCGTMNPVQNAYCDQCNARIVPMTAPSEKESEREQPSIRGLSLPTISLDEQPSPTASQEQETGEDTEDWLSQLRDSADESEMETPATEEKDSRDWLGQLRESTEDVEEGADWLAQLRDSTETEDISTPEPEAVAEPSEPTEIPDWLRDLGPVEVEQPPTEVAQEPAPSTAEGIAPEVAEKAAPEMPTPAEVPEWLQDLAPEEAAAPPVAGIEPAAEEAAPEMPAPAEVPEWLQKAAPPTPPFIDEPSPAEAKAPEWLAEIKEQAAPSPPAGLTPPFAVEPDTTAAEAAGLARAEIPAWLEAMRPTTETIEKTIEEEPAETEGLLQGLRGVLSPLPMVDVTRARESALPAEINQATLARAQLLQSLLTRPTEAPQPKARKRTAGMSELVPRLLIAIVLFVVVGGMLLISQDPALNSQIPSLAQPNTSSIARMYNLIEGVNEGETVLVALEYGPTNADELNSVARAILEHLIERKANISIASTQPEGLAVAEVLRSDINSQEQVVSGQQPALEYATETPGYRPGNATGISQILASIDTRPAMIIVLAAQPESLRWWIEQTRAHYGAAPPPIAAGVSAALEITSSPYLDANADQLKGIVSGLGGAVAYETRRGTAGQATRQLDALAAGHLVIVISMLAGAAFYAVGGSRRRGE